MLDRRELAELREEEIRDCGRMLAMNYVAVSCMKGRKPGCASGDYWNTTLFACKQHLPGKVGEAAPERLPSPKQCLRKESEEWEG
jgi:hypothetical protein